MEAVSEVVLIEDIHRVLQVVVEVQVVELVDITTTPVHSMVVREHQDKDLEEETQLLLSIRVVEVERMLKVPIQHQLQMVGQED